MIFHSRESKRVMEIMKTKGELVPHISVVKGIGRNQVEKLEKMKITSTSKLLEKCSLPVGRKELAEKLEIDPSFVMKWVIRCDFFRFKGMKCEFAQLMIEAGITSVNILSMSTPDEVFQAMTQVNEQKKLAIKLPSLEQIKKWIRQSLDEPSEVWYEGMYCHGF